MSTPWISRSVSWRSARIEVLPDGVSTDGWCWWICSWKPRTSSMINHWKILKVIKLIERVQYYRLICAHWDRTDILTWGRYSHRGGFQTYDRPISSKVLCLEFTNAEFKSAYFQKVGLGIHDQLSVESVNSLATYMYCPYTSRYVCRKSRNCPVTVSQMLYI